MASPSSVVFPSSDEEEISLSKNTKVKFEHAPQTPFITPASSPNAIAKFNELPLDNSSTDYSSSEEPEVVKKSILKPLPGNLKPVTQSKTIINTPKFAKKVVRKITPHDFQTVAVRNIGNHQKETSIEISPAVANVTPESDGRTALMIFLSVVIGLSVIYPVASILIGCLADEKGITRSYNVVSCFTWIIYIFMLPLVKWKSGQSCCYKLLHWIGIALIFTLLIMSFLIFEKFGKFIKEDFQNTPPWQLIYTFSSAIVNLCSALLGGILKIVFKKGGLFGISVIPADQLLLWLMGIDLPAQRKTATTQQ